ncbi:hypothetical protein D0T51_10280 [Parabacteroides sp. 52]|uniref:STN domain-containing protein n=1 Tax=Parabacteroides sp. 52 TaxID=2302940 RepID=UPI0013D87C76|nr:STN domain-containing protein [Parabacteroides sp. 52]NDV56112.1 hypothetical protein [Parabacteroides sp. 52]
MKASILLLFIGISIASAHTVLSQETTLTVELTDISIKEAIHEIENNSEYVFVFSDNIGKETERKVNVNLEQESIETILENMFAGTSLTYRILDKQVVILRDNTQKSASNHVLAPSQPILYKIRDGNKTEQIV